MIGAQPPMPMPNDAMMPQSDMPMDKPSIDGEDEESTPKKHIQQLTGTLSQELRMFNDTEKDSELNKFVAGMVISQASKGMTDDDKQDVINKIKKGNVSDEPSDDMNQEMPPMDNGQVPQSMESTPKMESRVYTKRMVNEIIGSVLDDDDIKSRYEKKSTNKAIKRNNPFVANR